MWGNVQRTNVSFPPERGEKTPESHSILFIPVAWHKHETAGNDHRLNNTINKHECWQWHRAHSCWFDKSKSAVRSYSFSEFWGKKNVLQKSDCWLVWLHIKNCWTILLEFVSGLLCLHFQSPVSNVKKNLSSFSIIWFGKTRQWQTNATTVIYQKQY